MRARFRHAVSGFLLLTLIVFITPRSALAFTWPRLCPRVFDALSDQFNPGNGIYNTSRGFDSYRRWLGEVFVQELAKLGKESHWVDGGAGEANAARDYLEGLRLRLRYWNHERPRITAITLERPSRPSLDRFLKTVNRDRFRYLEGRPVESYAASEIGPADLITDVQGAICHADRIDEVLNRYAEALKVGGTLLTVIPTKRTVPLSVRGVRFERVIVDASVRIGDAQGRAVTIEQWLRGVQGAEIKIEKASGPDGMHEFLRISFRKTADKVVIPKLTHLTTQGRPPIRYYRLD